MSGRAYQPCKASKAQRITVRPLDYPGSPLHNSCHVIPHTHCRYVHVGAGECMQSLCRLVTWHNWHRRVHLIQGLKGLLFEDCTAVFLFNLYLACVRELALRQPPLIPAQTAAHSSTHASLNAA